MKIGMRGDMPAHFSVVVDLDELAAEHGCTTDDLTQEHVLQAARLAILEAAYVMNRPTSNVCMSPEVDSAHFFDLCRLPGERGDYVMGTIYVMWGGPGWYAARIEDGHRVYYLVANEETNFGIGPTVHFLTQAEVNEKWAAYDVVIP